VPEGRFAPLFGLPEGWDDQPVAAFRLDARQVTVGEFRRFLAVKPEWTSSRRRGTAFADGSYLATFTSAPTGTGETGESFPITHVSWFAARAYCAHVGGRLPTTLEWEYVAAATPTQRNGTEDPAQTEAILNWYARPTGTETLREVGLGTPNVYGAVDMHTLVWEWTDDFNAAFLSTDSRSQGDRAKDLVCGAGAVGAARSTDYATYMRYAYRGSLQPTFTQPNLGFRCAYDEP
jgi:formylglycine-generating enzyme required for sulfatase activity